MLTYFLPFPDMFVLCVCDLDREHQCGSFSQDVGDQDCIICNLVLSKSTKCTKCIKEHELQSRCPGSDTDPPPTTSFITEKAVMNLGQSAPWDLGVVVTQN